MNTTIQSIFQGDENFQEIMRRFDKQYNFYKKGMIVCFIINHLFVFWALFRK